MSYKNNIIFFCLIGILLGLTNESSLYEIKSIASANLNATATFVSLDSLEDQEYIYFSFDFIYHNSVFPQHKDEAHFKISTDSVLRSSQIFYSYSDKKEEELKPSDITNLRWNQCYIVY